MEKVQNKLQQAVLNIFKTSKRERIIVGISGIPGSGKTSICNRLLRKFGEKCVCVPMDGFHFYKSELEKFDDPENAFKRRGAEFTFDSMKFKKLLENIKENKGNVLAPSFDHAVGDPIENDIKIEPSAEIVLCEGNYLLMGDHLRWKGITELLDFRIFVECDVDKAMERVVRRHVHELKLDKKKSSERAENNDKVNAMLIIKNSLKYTDLTVKSVFDENYVKKYE